MHRDINDLNLYRCLLIGQLPKFYTPRDLSKAINRSSAEKSTGNGFATLPLTNRKRKQGYTVMKNKLIFIVTRFPHLLVGIALAGTVALGLGIPKIELARSVDDSSLPDSNKLIHGLREVRSTFGDEGRLGIISIESPKTGKVTDPDHIGVIQSLVRGLETSPIVRISSVQSLATVNDFRLDGDDLESLPLIARVPTTELEKKDLENRIKSNEFVYGKLVSKDLRTSLIVIPLGENEDLTVIHNEFQRVIQPVLAQSPEFRISVMGNPEVWYYVVTAIEKESIIFIAISIFLITISFYLFFRSWRGVLIPMITILMGTIGVMGAMGLYGEPIFILSALMPVVIVVVGSSCAIHVYHSLRSEFAKHGVFSVAYEKMIERVASPILMASATTAIGALTLYMFKIRPLQHFGLFSAVGTALVGLLSVLVIPALWLIFGADSETKAIERSTALPKSRLHARLRSLSTGTIDLVLAQISWLATRKPWLILTSLAIILGLSIHQASRIQIGFDNLEFLPDGAALRETVDQFKQSFGGATAFDVLVDTKVENGATQAEFVKKLRAFEQAVQNHEGITHSFSYVHLIDKAHSVLNPSVPLDRLSSDMIAQYSFLISMSTGTSSMARLITSDSSKAKVSFTLAESDTKGLEPIYESIRKLGEETFGPNVGVQIGGSPVFDIAVSRYLAWGKVQNMLAAILLIFTIVLVVYRSISRSLITIIPLPISVILNFGLMGLLGIRLDYVSAMITSFAMGIGVDFSIHFLAGLRKASEEEGRVRRSVEKAIQGPGKAILYNVICCVLGFAVPLVSNFAPIRTFAILICFNMIVMVLATFIVIPAVVRLSVPRFIGDFGYAISEQARRMYMISKVGFSTALILALSFGIYLTESMASSDTNAKELLKKSVKASHFDHEQSVYVMRLFGKDGKESIRKMNVWFQSSPNDDIKMTIKFTEPANIRGTGLLNVSEGGSVQQWLYLPSIKRSRRITGSSSNESFLGSDFRMSDISVSGDDQYEFKVTGSGSCGGTVQGDCFLVEGTPKGAASGDVYSKQVLHIHKASYLNVYSEFHNQSKQLEKVLTLHGVKQDSQKRWTAEKVEMKNVLTGTKTLIEYEKRDLKTKPEGHVFTRQFLEK